MQSHFPPSENTVLYISVITPQMHRQCFISSILLGLFGEMKTLNALIRVTGFVCPFTNSWERVCNRLTQILSLNRTSSARLHFKALFLPACIFIARFEMVKLASSSLSRGIRSSCLLTLQALTSSSDFFFFFFRISVTQIYNTSLKRLHAQNQPRMLLWLSSLDVWTNPQGSEVVRWHCSHIHLWSCSSISFMNFAWSISLNPYEVQHLISPSLNVLHAHWYCSEYVRTATMVSWQKKGAGGT